MTDKTVAAVTELVKAVVTKGGTSEGAKKGWLARKGMRVLHAKHGAGTVKTMPVGGNQLGGKIGVLFDAKKDRGVMPVDKRHLTPAPVREMYDQNAANLANEKYSPEKHARLLDLSRGRGNKASAKVALKEYEDKHVQHAWPHEDLEDAGLLPEQGTYEYAEKHKSQADDIFITAKDASMLFPDLEPVLKSFDRSEWVNLDKLVEKAKKGGMSTKDPGLFTRCMQTSGAKKASNPGAYCASIHDKITGHWPAEDADAKGRGKAKK